MVANRFNPRTTKKGHHKVSKKKESRADSRKARLFATSYASKLTTT